MSAQWGPISPFTFLLLGLTVPSAGLFAQEVTGEATELDELTVVSSKRDLPISLLSSGVSIRNEHQLEEARVTETSSLEKLVPSLKVNMRSSRAYSTFTIRGIGSADFYNPAVAVYVDGVPQDASNLDQMLADAERVEVLKGPQGTLYGRNAHAGVINITTRQADNEPRADLQVTAANLKPDAQAVLAAPLIEDVLFGSAVLKVAADRGQSDNLVTAEEDDDSATNSVYRGTLRYAPEGGPLDVALSLSRDHLDAEELFFDEASFEDKESSVPFTDIIERDVQTGSLSINGDLGSLALTSVTSLQRMDLNRDVGIPADERQTSASEEVRAAYAPDNQAWSGLLGAFVQSAEFERDSISNFTGNPYDADVDTQSYALFGEGTYDVTEAFSATLGMRYARDWAELDFEENGGLVFKEDDDWSAFLPKLGLNYQIHEDISLYSTLSRGYKPGGFNRTATNEAAEIPYDNEYSTNFEAGLRYGALDGSLPLQASVYWTEIDDIQIFTGEIGQQVIRNLGDARSYGFEAEGSAFVTEQLEMSAGLHVNKTEFKDGAEANGVDLEGNRLPFAPEYAVTLAAQYHFESPSLPGVIRPRAAISYYGDTFFEETNSFDQDSYGIVDLSVTYEDVGFSVTGFVDNVLDKTYKVYQASENTIQIGEGLNAGVRFNVRF